MKKWLLALLIILTVIIILLPSGKKLHKSFVTGIPHEAILRQISDTTGWKLWWPGDSINDSTFTVGNKTLIKSPVLMSGFTAKEKQDGINLSIQYLPQAGHSTSFDISSTTTFSKNPIKKIAQYIDFISWEKTFNGFTDSMKKHFSNEERVYGFRIENQKVQDPAYISFTKEFMSEPSWDSIYSMIDEIKNYVSNSKAQVVNHPIFHMTIQDSTWTVMVACATNRVLPTEGKFMLKQMFRGNILVGEVKGGSGKVAQCEQAMEHYVLDHQKGSPAIPFQRLVTDRRQFPDSAHWITQVNYPVYE